MPPRSPFVVGLLLLAGCHGIWPAARTEASRPRATEGPPHPRRTAAPLATSPNPDPPAAPHPPRSLMASWYRLCEHTVDRTVLCLGNNEFGELGDGTFEARSTFAPVFGLHDVVELALGGEHSCALLTDHTVRCWGANPFGQLGDGTSTRSPLPVAVVGLEGVVEIAAGAFHTCARVRDGRVLCWGGNLGGMPVEHKPSTAYRLRPLIVPGIASATSIWLGHERSYARLEDGHVLQWGFFSVTKGAPIPLVGLSEDGEITSGWSHECQRTSRGAVRCWGSNSYAQLGGDTANVPAETKPVELPPVTKLVIGHDHTLALTVDGEVYGWGANEAGQLGDRERVPQSVARVPGISNAIDVAAGWDFGCARLRDGTISCWGANRFVPTTPH